MPAALTLSVDVVLLLSHVPTSPSGFHVRLSYININYLFSQ